MPRTMTARALLLVLAAYGLGVLAACGKGSASGSNIIGPPAGVAECQGNALLSRSPVAIDAIQNIGPLGNLNPPGHVFPSDHAGIIAMPGIGTPAVVAPGNVTIAQLGQQTQTTGGKTDVDYMVKFFPCSDVMFWFGHLGSLSPDLLAQAGSFAGNCGPSYVIGSTTYLQCFKDVNLAVTVGSAIGTLRTDVGADFGAYDRRTTLAYVDPARTLGGSGDFGANHAVCPVDYFTSDVAAALRPLFGGRGGVRRTALPLCGDVNQDVAGTAQGRWYYNADETEAPHLALVHDPIDASGTFSVGTSIPTLPMGGYFYTPLPTGRVNADFSRVTADGTVYCYEVVGMSSKRVYLKMTDASTLMIGATSAGTCGDPSTWSVAFAATQFKR